MITGMRSFAVLAAVVLLLGACSSDDPEELSLDDGSEVAAPEDEEPSGEEEPVEPADDGEDPDGEVESHEGDLYPPLPPLEPNPESDVPIEDQEFFLELYEEYHRVTSEALTTNTWDEEAAAEVAAGQELQHLRESVDQSQEDETVLILEDTRIEWVEVVQAQGGAALVQECRIDGPASGRANAETRELLEPGGEPVARVFQARYAFVEQDDGTFAPRVTELLTAEDQERCRA